MSKEQAAFQKKQAKEMSQIKAIFSKGFAQIENAKSIADEVSEEAEEADAEITEQEPVWPGATKSEAKPVHKKKDKPNSLVQV